MIEVDAVVLDLDGGSMLEECIAALLAQTVPFARLIVVDNGSEVAVRDRLGGFSDRVELIRLEKNLGFAKGMNAGIVASSAPLVALVNNDATLDPRWVAEVSEAVLQNTTVASAQSVNLGRDGRVDGAGIDLKDGTVRQLGHGSRVGEVDLESASGVSATAALYRRAAVESVVGADEWFVGGYDTWYEDVELALRLHTAGFQHRIVEEPLVVHVGAGSSGRIGAFRRARVQTRNRHFLSRSFPRLVRARPLLEEDAREFVKALVRGRPKRALGIKVGAVEGRLSPVPERGSAGRL